MLARDIIESAQEVELKQLKMRDDKQAVLRLLNLGVLELHKRFDLINDESVITMADGVTLYTLDGQDPNVSIDLNTHRLMMITEAYDNIGASMTINDENDQYGIATPRWNQVEVPEVVVDENISIIYRAAPIKATSEGETLPLPPQFEEALLAYIGYRGYSTISGSQQTENNPYWKKFEGSCNRIDRLGLINQDALSSGKFQDRGFV